MEAADRLHGPRVGAAPQRGAAGRRTELRQGAGRGDALDRRAAVEQLGPQSQLRRRHARLAGAPGRPGSSSPQRPVGQPLEINFSAADYQPQVRFITPDADAPPTTVDAVRAADGQWLATLVQTDRSGFYEAQLARSNGKVEIRREAVNVDAAEGDLRALFGPELAARLQPEVKYQFDQAETFELALDQRAGYNLGDAVLYLLLALLIGEQLLAYSAGYHPAAREKAAAWSAWQLQGGGP